jgi:hypothetical protein
MKKVGISVWLIILLCCVGVNAQESMKFDSEAKKLQFLRHLLLKEKHGLSGDNPCYCKQMIKDLLEGKNFKAIEPDVRTDFTADPRLEKWDQCDQKDYRDLPPDVNSEDMFLGLDTLGDPPYRYYRIELDGNKKDGPEDLIYTSGSTKLGRNAGYTWVNLKRCEIEEQVSVVIPCNFSPKPNGICLNLLVYYKGKPWIIDFVEESNLGLFSIEPKGVARKFCGWLFHKPK